MIPGRSWIALLIFAAALTAAAQPPAAEYSCIVIQELDSTGPLATRGDGCATRLSPASTFKIPHALVALETGAATLDGIERWDRTRYERQREWNRDHTIISALRPSVLWLFQRVAPRIGAPRMSEWLAKFDYGNRDASGPIAEYWINGVLKISAPEQVRFLRRFYKGDLPVQPQYLRAVRDGLEQQPGTVENALGVQRMPGDWHRASLNSKTGATTADGARVSWLVGLFGDAKGREYVFASAVWRRNAAVDTLDGARLAVTTFADLGLLPRQIAEPGR
jgi:beta-lactamase class D